MYILLTVYKDKVMRSTENVIKDHCLTTKIGKNGDFPQNTLIPGTKRALIAFKQSSPSM